MTSKEQKIANAVNHYIITMPIGLMLEMFKDDMMDYFINHAENEEVEEFLLEFGPNNAPKGAH